VRVGSGSGIATTNSHRAFQPGFSNGGAAGRLHHSSCPSGRARRGPAYKDSQKCVRAPSGPLGAVRSEVEVGVMRWEGTHSFALVAPCQLGAEAAWDLAARTGLRVGLVPGNALLKRRSLGHGVAAVPFLVLLSGHRCSHPFPQNEFFLTEPSHFSNGLSLAFAPPSRPLSSLSRFPSERDFTPIPSNLGQFRTPQRHSSSLTSPIRL
jgi:hypothetical protein